MSSSQIRSPRRLLSADEILVHSQKVSIPEYKSKKVKPENTEEEHKYKEQLINGIKKLLGQERVGRKSARSIGVYQPDENRVYVTKMIGKWNKIGVMEKNKFYLAHHEALYLLEMNNLIIYFDGVVMSLEQAYCLFLNNDFSLPIEKYFVYSHLMKAGYNVQIYKPPIAFVSHVKDYSYKNSRLSMKQKYIWDNLHVLLKRKRKFVPENEELYTKITNSMNKTKNIIKKYLKEEEKAEEVASTSNNSEENFSLLQIACKKRKYDKTMKSTKQNEIPDEYNPKSVLNCLKFEAEYELFKDLFVKFDIIELNSEEVEIEESLETTNKLIDFDFYLPQTKYKKSEVCTPNYRICVVRWNEKSPNKTELLKLYKQQTTKCAILVIFVDESMAFHGFIYKFA